MLNGLDPIIIFHISKVAKSAEESIAKIPVLSSVYTKIGLPPIPIYLSESATGLFIDTEEKNIDIETEIETLVLGGEPKVRQKALNATVRVQMKAKKDSLGLVLLSALCDLILPKVTSGEYSISYLHDSTTIFGGLIHSFAVQASSDNDLLMVTLEIVKTTQLSPVKTAIPEVSANAGSGSLAGSNSGLSPTAPIPDTPLKGPSGPIPVPPSTPAPIQPPLNIGGPS